MISVHSTPEELGNGGFTLKTQQVISVHSTPEELENGGFTLKKQQIFSVHSTPEELENGGFTLKTQEMFSVTLHRGGIGKRRFHSENTRNVFRHTTPRRNWKTEVSL